MLFETGARCKGNGEALAVKMPKKDGPMAAQSVQILLQECYRASNLSTLATRCRIRQMTFIACRLVPCGAFGHALMFAALIPELLTLCAAPREIQGHSNIVKALGVLGTMTLWQLA